MTDPTIDECRFFERKDNVVQLLRSHVNKLLESYDIEVIHATASFIDDQTVKLSSSKEDYIKRFDRVIIATGSVSQTLPGFEFNGTTILDSNQLLSLNKIPKSIIIGGGVIGCEFACYLNACGCKVTMVEAQSRILPECDVSISQALTQIFKKRGIDIHTNQRVSLREQQHDQIMLTGDGIDLNASCVLLAIGGPNTALLDLDNAHVDLDSRGFIHVDQPV